MGVCIHMDVVSFSLSLFLSLFFFSLCCRIVPNNNYSLMKERERERERLHTYIHSYFESIKRRDFLSLRVVLEKKSSPVV